MSSVYCLLDGNSTVVHMGGGLSGSVGQDIHLTAVHIEVRIKKPLVAVRHDAYIHEFTSVNILYSVWVLLMVSPFACSRTK